MNDKVLIVDDSPEILFGVSTLLSHLGFSVGTADGGAKGLRMLQEETYGAVLLDYRMPEMNGLEFLIELQKLPQCSDITTIVTTASIESGEECLDCGADSFVPKPIDFDRLIAILHRALARTENEQAAGDSSSPMVTRNSVSC